jgi:hypothetical protein
MKRFLRLAAPIAWCGVWVWAAAIAEGRSGDAAMLTCMTVGCAPVPILVLRYIWQHRHEPGGPLEPIAPIRPRSRLVYFLTFAVFGLIVFPRLHPLGTPAQSIVSATSTAAMFRIAWNWYRAERLARRANFPSVG